MKKQVRVILMVMVSIMVMLMLGGCGRLTESTEKKLYKRMQEEGLLEFDCRFGDYTELREEDQSPIPVIVKYYDYEFDGVKYTINYRSTFKEDDEDTVLYRVFVLTNRGGKESGQVYLFDKDTLDYVGTN